MRRRSLIDLSSRAVAAGFRRNIAEIESGYLRVSAFVALLDQLHLVFDV
jgi:hypothetical protein